MGGEWGGGGGGTLNFSCYVGSALASGVSALDKLLGQLGIYATWLSSIAYLQKQLRTPRFWQWLHMFSN